MSQLPSDNIELAELLDTPYPEYLVPRGEEFFVIERLARTVLKLAGIPLRKEYDGPEHSYDGKEF
jgi:hypothetical protein